MPAQTARPSAPQILVLRAAAAGTLYHSERMHSLYKPFIRTGGRVSVATVRAAKNAGWIELSPETRTEPLSTPYRITEAGTAALATVEA